MKKFLKMTVVVCVVAITGCAATGEVNTLTFADGSIFQHGAIADGATQYDPWKFYDAKTGEEIRGVERSDSMAARILPGVLQIGTNAIINGQYAKDISRKNGNGGAQFNNFVQSQSGSEATAATEAPVCTACGLLTE